MKKNKIIKSVFLILSIFIFSCKSAPKDSSIPVNAIDTLDDKGALYIHIPKNNNEKLLSSFVQQLYQNLSKETSDLIVSNLDNVYASFGGIKNKSRFQVAADGKIPKATTSLLKKNGFKENSYTATSLINKSTIFTYLDDSKLQLATIENDKLIISNSINQMLDTYNIQKEILNTPNLEIDERVVNTSWKESDLYNWIDNKDSSINFYIVRPQAFLTNLIGSAISTKLFKLVYAKGKFNKLDDSYYGLDLELEFINPSFVKPAVSILILTLGLTDSEVVNTSSTHVVVKGVRINSKQLINMLGI